MNFFTISKIVIFFSTTFTIYSIGALTRQEGLLYWVVILLGFNLFYLGYSYKQLRELEHQEEIREKLFEIWEREKNGGT